jgi:ubiquinone/menaquinone biosynthesis C-methylase UbiE
MTGSENPAWVYEKYQVSGIFQAWARVLIEIARPQAGEAVLDACCGTGVVARLLIPLVGPAGRIVGFDLDPQMLEVAKALAPAVEWRQGDLQVLPFADASFDLAVCQQGLQFLPDKAAGLREMHRVLRPGGRIVLALWSDLANSPGHAAVFGAVGRLLGKDMSKPPAWSLAEESEALALVSSAGFVDIKSTVKSLPVAYPSARTFAEAMVAGASKQTRELLQQVDADRRGAFVDDVVARLRRYETPAGLTAPMESRLVWACKRRA